MPFYRYRNENQNFQPQLSFGPKKFAVSNEAFNRGSTLSFLTINTILFVLFITRAAYSISETDIQCISQITAGLSGLTLAIPLFLKDFDFNSNFWRQFYLISIVFIIATFAGLLGFLKLSSNESKTIIIYFWFFLSLTLSTSITTIRSNQKGLRILARIIIKANPVLDFCLSVLFLVISMSFAKGDFLFYGLILFSVYGFYLTLALMLSIVIELYLLKPNKSYDERIKLAIEKLAYDNKKAALSEQMLLDKLKSEHFINEPEVISRSKVEDLVMEMDHATEPSQPKITIYQNEKIIPRWIKEFEGLLAAAKTKCILLESTSYSKFHSHSYFDSSDFTKDFEEKCYDLLSAETGLSYELLKEHNAISNKYSPRKKMTLWCMINDSYYEDKFTNRNVTFILLSDRYNLNIHFDQTDRNLPQDDVELTSEEAELLYNLFVSGEATLLVDGKKQIEIISTLERLIM